MIRRAYQTDLSDAEWALIEPHLPAPRAPGRPRLHPLREILDAFFFYVVRGGCRGGCTWRLLPHDFPTVGRASTITSEPGAQSRHLGATPRGPAQEGSGTHLGSDPQDPAL